MYKQIVKPLAAIATGTTTSIGVALCLAMLATISMADSGKTNIPGIDREVLVMRCRQILMNGRLMKCLACLMSIRKA